MTKGWPSCSCSFCAIMRAAMSVACPGGHGTTTLTARAGYGCASTPALKSMQKIKAARCLISEGPGIGPAVHQQVLAGNVTRLRAAEICAGVAELLRGAEAPGRIRFRAAAAQLVVALAACLGVEFEVGAQAIGVERPRQQVVDRDVAAHGLARKAGDEAGQPGARAVGEPEFRNRIL